MKKIKGNKPVKDVIAFRKACKPKGAGLSHYVLMGKKAR